MDSGMWEEKPHAFSTCVMEQKHPVRRSFGHSLARGVNLSELGRLPRDIIIMAASYCRWEKRKVKMQSHEEHAFLSLTFILASLIYRNIAGCILHIRPRNLICLTQETGEAEEYSHCLHSFKGCLIERYYVSSPGEN